MVMKNFVMLKRVNVIGMTKKVKIKPTQLYHKIDRRLSRDFQEDQSQTTNTNNKFIREELHDNYLCICI